MVVHWITNSTPLEKIYVGLALSGLIITQYFNYQYFLQSGGSFDVLAWLMAGYANPAASAMSSELWIGSTACLIFLYFEAKRLGMKNKWLYIIGAQLFGFVVFMPLFFMIREKHLFCQKLPSIDGEQVAE